MVTTVLFVSFGVPIKSFAAESETDDGESNIEVIELEPSRDGPSAEDGFDVLLGVGHTFELADTFDTSVLEFISEASSVQQYVKYYNETYNLDEEAYDIQEIDQDEFVTLSHDAFDDIPLNYSQRVFPEEYFSRSGPEQPGPSAINGGNLTILVSIFYNANQGPNSTYTVVAEYAWYKMPSCRRNDYFGITRGNNTVVVPGSYSSYKTYKERQYIYIATGGTVGCYPGNTYTHYTQGLPNYAGNYTAFVNHFVVPEDLTPPTYLFNNQSFTARYYSGLRGGITYSGKLQAPGLGHQYVNHWITYLHQKKGSLNVSISLNIPLGAAMSISSGAPKYSPPITVTTLTYL